jgi:hypothetical protein
VSSGNTFFSIEDMSICKVINKSRSYIYILTLLLFPNIAYCQADAYGYGLLFSLLENYKDHREQVFIFEKRMKGMTTLSGYSYAGTTNDKAKREVNSYYDMQIQKAEAEYAFTIRNSNPETPEGELYNEKRYRIYMDKLSKIALRRNKSLDQLEHNYNLFIKVYSPYWSRNDNYGKLSIQ